MQYGGADYSSLLRVHGRMLRELFFPPEVAPAPSVNYTSDSTDVVTDFDPITTPPNAFELQFGLAYYE